MNFMFRLRTAAAMRPVMSFLGPILAAFQRVSLLSQLDQPSACSATGPANLAPARWNSSAHSSASNFSAVNCGMKSL